MICRIFAAEKTRTVFALFENGRQFDPRDLAQSGGKLCQMFVLKAARSAHFVCKAADCRLSAEDKLAAFNAQSRGAHRFGVLALKERRVDLRRVDAAFV